MSGCSSGFANFDPEFVRRSSWMSFFQAFCSVAVGLDDS